MSFVTRTGLLLSVSLLAACSSMQKPNVPDAAVEQSGLISQAKEPVAKPAAAAVKAKIDPKDHGHLYGIQRVNAADRKKVTEQATPASEVIMEAIGLIGTPYRWGGTDPSTGFDCSGLILHVFGDTGIDLPRSSRDMASMGAAKTVSRDQLKPGDLLFFSSRRNKRVDHAAIYIGDNRFVHSPSRGGRVRLDDLEAAYWKRAYLTAKRVL
ncbi:cell wall-associated NlpC family hydrolase [Pseudomonas nitritireducens]|uniref:Cell wall-associated NlpC family hydrolase n=1 Tax=Pseudomonas nitroreducens TaxID=46680 RepID=A0A7W7KST1_PSENT|nr:C40 family peptidase [Pseudomonas nitritireducens]MBB4867838.1 cell wall-associated NlpC family hydrolase [Pseudomonas nitritireducens]